MTQQLKKIATFVLRFVISFLFLGIVLFSARGRFVEALAHFKHLVIWPLFVAASLNFISLIPVTQRLKMILKIQGVKIPFWRQYYLWVISLFFNLFLPSAVGGDIAKAYYLAKDSGKKMACITSVLLDRFFGLVASVSIGFFAFTLVRKQIHDPRIALVLYWFAVFIFVFLMFILSRRFSNPVKSFLLFLTPKRFKEKFMVLFDAMDLYRAKRGNFFIAFGYSVIAQVIFITLIYCLALSLSINVPYIHYFLIIPLVTLFSMIPSLGGLGVREAAIVYLFSKYISIDKSIALSMMCDVFIYGIGAACGILYAIKGGASVKEIEEIEETVE